MIKLGLFELLLTGFIVALSIPLILSISGDIQTAADTATAENEFSALFILESGYEFLSGSKLF